MADSISREVRFVYSGLNMTKTVTKTTICDDVIRDLHPQPQERLSIYESVNGIVKELPGKTRLLKGCRAHGSKWDGHFIIKKTSDKITTGLGKLNLKAKLEAFSRRLSKSSSRIIRRKTTTVSSASLGSHGSSTARSCEMRIHRFWSSRSVTPGQIPELDGTPRRATFAATTTTTTTTRNRARSVSTTDIHVVGDRLTSMILGFKKAPTSNESLRSGTGDRDGSMPNKHRLNTILQSDTDEYPLHSTPVSAVTSHVERRRVVMRLPPTPTAAKLSRNCRKSRYNSGKTTAVDGRKSPALSSTPNLNTSRGTSSRAIREDCCRCNYNRMCDSDSDSSFESSSVCSRLDVAFCDPSIPSDISEHSDVSDDGFEYSFDCTFPTMADSCQSGILGFGSDGERSDNGLTSFRGDSASSLRVIAFV